MEAVRSRRSKAESSPDRMGTMSNKPMSRRVQVVYYLTRNGTLEHPHFMEVLVPANQPLRLRDVMDRLKALRGKGMPSLYSWSCKRSYRNGFVWNDLAKNDVVYPSDGYSEYVLKGSELVEGRSEKFQEIQGSINKPPSGHMQQASNVHLLRSKPKPETRETRDLTAVGTASFGEREIYNSGEVPEDEGEEDEEEEEEEEEYELEEEKTSYTSSTTPRSRCSRGVSTEELEFPVQERRRVADITSAEPTRSRSAEKTRFDSGVLAESKRFEDGDPVEFGSGQSGRGGSFLLQLIACGNMAVAKAKNAPSLMMKQKEETLRKGVLRKNVINKVVGEEDREMIRAMPENPRFGNSQAEDKEYFSGSIVEATSQERVMAEPVLMRSNSFSEERNKDTRTIKEDDKEGEEKEEMAAKGKCIPRKKNTSWSIPSSSNLIKN